MPPRLPKSVPHLPPRFIHDILSDPIFEDMKSLVFSNEFNRARHSIAGKPREEPSFCDPHVVCPQVDSQFSDVDKRTFLHYAAKYGDFLLACECIRLGATVDCKDAHGITPLLFALQHLICNKRLSTVQNIGLHNLSPAQLSRAPPIFPDDQLHRQRQRITKVVTMLIEQHASFSVKVDKQTPLHLACEAGNWDLIEMMLKHGARPYPGNLPPVDKSFRTAVDKDRFKALVHTHSNFSTRPPRICPCWSGKLLSECHDNGDVPYPPEYICKCGSQKSYGRCCLLRNVEFKEKWDEEEQWLQGAEVRRVDGIAMGLLPILNAAQEMDHKVLLSEMLDVQRSVAEELVLSGEIDPVFGAALKMVDFQPRPWGRRLSKIEAKKRQKEWNDAINIYIETGVDPRSREEIEIKAKIGITGGALHASCEGIDCPTVSRPGRAKLLTCKCKMAFYCSVPCQKSAWRTHKKVCSKEDQEEQSLPSQIALAKWHSDTMGTLGNLLNMSQL